MISLTLKRLLCTYSLDYVHVRLTGMFGRAQCMLVLV